MMKVKKKKYLITWYTQIDDDYIDVRQIVLKNKYNAKNMYNDLASKSNTISIEMEELWWLFINYSTMKLSKMST